VHEKWVCLRSDGFLTIFWGCTGKACKKSKETVREAGPKLVKRSFLSHMANFGRQGDQFWECLYMEVCVGGSRSSCTRVTRGDILSLIWLTYQEIESSYMFSALSGQLLLHKTLKNPKMQSYFPLHPKNNLSSRWLPIFLLEMMHNSTFHSKL